MLKKALIVIITAVIFKSFLEYTFGPYNSSDNSANKTVDTPAHNEESQTQTKTETIKAPQVKVFTREELAKASTDTKLYLAILGHVYDVSKGGEHYAKGGSYNFFIGVDASRAYVTGDFKNDLNDKVDDLSQAQVSDLFNWKSFYDKTYTFAGYVSGSFYDSNGQPTEYFKKVESLYKSQQKVDEKNKEFNTMFPSCNSEWSQDKGVSKVWCTPESGGVKRSWSGFPRLVRNPNTKQENCACVNENDLDHPSVKPYPNCDPKSTECHPNI